MVRHAALAGGSLLVLALAATVAARSHGALLYPDGYQYLLMARGLGDTGRAVADLGGWTLMPNADAAAKPLLPGLLVLLGAVGVGGAAGAAAIAVVALATAVVAAAWLVQRLTGSPLGAIAAGGALAASPGAVYWLGFAGPDALGLALTLAGAAAAAWRRPALAGVLLGFAGAARPELLLAGAVIAFGVWLTRPADRGAVLRGVASGLLALAAVIALVRPPLLPPAGLALAPVAAVGGALLWCGADRLSRLPRAVAAVSALAAAAALGTLVAVGRLGALGGLDTTDRALAALAAIGAAAALAAPATRSAAGRVIAVALPLAAVYALRNSDSERYLMLLAPLAAVLLGLGVAALPSRAVRVPAALALAGLALAGPGARSAPAEDVFSRAAPALARHSGEALVTAAPDAYGSLAPGAPIRPLEAGRRGLIVLDAVQRLHHPELAAQGRVVARVPAGAGFLRPDGRVDRHPTLLVRGVVTAPPHSPGKDSDR